MQLDLSTRTVTDLISRGVIPRGATVDVARVAYIRHLRGRAAGQVGEGGLVLADEKARLAKEQADRLEMDNREARGEAARWEDVEAFLVPICSGLVQRILAMPAKAAPEAHGASTIAKSEEAIRLHALDALVELTGILEGGPAERHRRVAAEAAKRRRLARQRAAPAEAADGQRVGGGGAAGSGGDEPGAGAVEEPAVPA